MGKFWFGSILYRGNKQFVQRSGNERPRCRLLKSRTGHLATPSPSHPAVPSLFKYLVPGAPVRMTDKRSSVGEDTCPFGCTRSSLDLCKYLSPPNGLGTCFRMPCPSLLALPARFYVVASVTYKFIYTMVPEPARALFVPPIDGDESILN